MSLVVKERYYNGQKQAMHRDQPSVGGIFPSNRTSNNSCSQLSELRIKYTCLKNINIRYIYGFYVICLVMDS